MSPRHVPTFSTVARISALGLTLALGACVRSPGDSSRTVGGTGGGLPSGAGGQGSPPNGGSAGDAGAPDRSGPGGKSGGDGVDASGVPAGDAAGGAPDRAEAAVDMADRDGDADGVRPRDSAGGGPDRAGASGDSGSDGRDTGGVSAEDAAGVTAYDIVTSSLIDGASTHWEQGRDIAFDSQGNIVVVGGTSSANFPTTAGAYDRVYSGGGTPGRGAAGDTDAFVAKFDRKGRLLWSTFLGGYNYDRAYAVEIAANDDVIVAGRAGDGFPTTAGVIQPAFAGDTDASANYGKQDGFVARLKADGSGLVWSTYFGSTGQGIIRDMDLDAEGNVYVALTGENAPLAYAPENASGRNTIKGPGWDGYYGKISADGKRLLFGTFYGGSTGAQDSINPSIRVVGGDVYIVASTNSTDVDCINGNAYQKVNAGGMDLLVMRYAANYTKVFCTYLGGSGDEVLETHILSVTAGGNVVVAGGTNSRDFPTTAGAAQQTPGGGSFDGQISILSGDGTKLLAATYVGGTDGDGLEGLGIVPGGDIVFAGSTESTLPVSAVALQKNRQARDAIFGRISPDLGTLRYLTYFGGSLNEEFRALAVGHTGDVAMTGQTQSSDFPFKNAFDTTIEPGSYKPDEAVIYTVLSPR